MSHCPSSAVAPAALTVPEPAAIVVATGLAGGVAAWTSPPFLHPSVAHASMAIGARPISLRTSEPPGVEGPDVSLHLYHARRARGGATRFFATHVRHVHAVFNRPP
jgi:hypothetical protein